MKRLAATAVFAWLLAVCLLWFMMIIDDDDVSWLQIATSESTLAPAAESAASSASNPPGLSCIETENSLRDRLQTATYCATDSDCTLFDFGYPIDCMTSVAKSEITALRLEYRKYEQSCDFRVFFDCPAEPMHRHAVCQENRCAVSLRSIDTLEEQTLEYLGLKNSGTR